MQTCSRRDPCTTVPFTEPRGVACFSAQKIFKNRNFVNLSPQTVILGYRALKSQFSQVNLGGVPPTGKTGRRGIGGSCGRQTSKGLKTDQSIWPDLGHKQGSNHYSKMQKIQNQSFEGRRKSGTASSTRYSSGCNPKTRYKAEVLKSQAERASGESIPEAAHTLPRRGGSAKSARRIREIV